VRAGATELDICVKCTGVALDPGEITALKSMHHDTFEKAVDALGCVEALAQVLELFH
jgi:Zn-finger nucleic acid-binding protein